MATKDYHSPLYKREATLVDVNGVPYDGSNPLPVTSSGGGGGAVTMAAGAVSAGAYVLGSLVDGAVVTLGALADAAVGDGPGSLNAHTRQIAKLLGAGISLGAGAAVIGAVTQSGTWTVTANAGTGTLAVSAVSLPLPTGAATDRTTAAGPFAVRLSDGASFITNLPVQGAKTSNGAVPGADNIGALAAIATAAAPTNTEGRMVALSADLAGALRVVLPGTSTVTGTVTANAGTGTFTVAGAKTHNAAAPGATNIGALPAIATAAVPSLTEGNLVGLSTDLSGFLRGIVQGVVASGVSAVGVNPVLVGMNGAGAVVRNLTEANAVAATTGTALLGVGPLVWDLAGGVNWQKIAGDASGRQIVVGAAAAGAAVAGNPLLMGISDATNSQTWRQGQATNAAIAVTGYPGVVMMGNNNGGNLATVNALAPVDGIAQNNNGMLALGVKYSWNLATLDRDRNNVDVILLASASRTTTQNSASIVTYNARALYVCLDVTTAGTGSITLSINWICPASGKVINLLTGTAVTTVTTNVYKVGIGLTAAANAVGVDYLCRTITINVTANNANAVTYSVGYCLIAA